MLWICSGALPATFGRAYGPVVRESGLFTTRHIVGFFFFQRAEKRRSKWGQ